MNTNDLDRMKSLLGVMVRRHSRHGANHPSNHVGALIAREANRMDTHGSTGGGKDAQLVESLYRRLVTPRHSTVALADCPSIALEEIHS